MHVSRVSYMCFVVFSENSSLHYNKQGRIIENLQTNTKILSIVKVSLVYSNRVFFVFFLMKQSETSCLKKLGEVYSAPGFQCREQCKDTSS